MLYCSWISYDPSAKLSNTDLNTSDTVAATLSFLLYELCKNLEIQAKLRAAIDSVKTEKAHLDVEDLTECVYLDGIINETLRLHPAVWSSEKDYDSHH
jgi:cytochrome P450